ncbi:uncharacterized protein [Apostichopus japonicus]|uniref:uncharacterized protein n=1 Tax=Stichopus japonicus TaxID=307972 RepID=UPI003AB26167
MEHFLLCIVILNWMLRSVNGEGMTFNTTYSDMERRFFAYTGDAIVLTCNPPEEAKRVVILKGQHPHTQFLLQGRKLSASDKRYQVLSSKEEYKLLILDLNKSDSAIYTCTWDFPWYSPIKWVFWNEEIKARLQVVNRQMNECVLLNGFDGIFFAGENFDLYCPKDIAIDLYIANENEVITVQTICIVTNKNVVLRRIHNVSTRYNNSRLVCNKNGSDKDYCISTPNITVYEDLQVTVEPHTVNVIEGENLTLTCSTFPRIQASIEWDLSGSRNIISNANLSHSSNGYESIMLTFSFQNETKLKDQYSIKCRVTIGSNNITKTITIQQKRNSTTDFTVTTVIIGLLVMVTLIVIYFLYTKRRNGEARRTESKDIGNLYESVIHVDLKVSNSN